MNSGATLDRFWAKVHKPSSTYSSDCWEWTSTLNHAGYGLFVVDGRRVRAHRFAWELVNAALAPGLTLDHLCKNHRCVRPTHLEAVTQRVNVLRGDGPCAKHALKTHCPKGHEYTTENTRVRRRRRECMSCIKEARAAKKAWRSGAHR